MSLQPIGFEAYLLYQCPKCQTKELLPAKVATRPHAMLDCWCGKSTSIAQLKNVKVNASLAGKKDITPEYDEKYAISMIKAQGFSAQEAQELIVRAKVKKPKTLSDLIRFAIAESNDGATT